MLDRLFGGGSLPALEAMLTFASARQKVIAANIANVDTVGYRARDLSAPDFRKPLAEAFWPQEAWTADAGILKANGNNVDLEIEMARMVRNSALHSAAATLLANQYALLREAVSGHVNS
jgi:flagellar basal-body rod protein FlgB